jgi:hypothetical protein
MENSEFQNESLSYSFVVDVVQLSESTMDELQARQDSVHDGIKLVYIACGDKFISATLESTVLNLDPMVFMQKCRSIFVEIINSHGVSLVK